MIVITDSPLFVNKILPELKLDGDWDISNNSISNLVMVLGYEHKFIERENYNRVYAFLKKKNLLKDSTNGQKIKITPN